MSKEGCQFKNPTGPFTEDAVRKGLADGTFPTESKAWKEGMDCWKTLAELFGGAKEVSNFPVNAVQQVVIPIVEPLPENAKSVSATPSTPVKKKRRVKKRAGNVPPVGTLPASPRLSSSGQNALPLVGFLLILAGIFIICIPDVLNQYLHLW